LTWFYFYKSEKSLDRDFEYEYAMEQIKNLKPGKYKINLEKVTDF